MKGFRTHSLGHLNAAASVTSPTVTSLLVSAARVLCTCAVGTVYRMLLIICSVLQSASQWVLSEMQDKV